jgi:hypothetical protein|tara:strand:+ start:792 stop:2051 length:1260 start_codon:yes stop_codon:yes gene_type:complete
MKNQRKLTFNPKRISAAGAHRSLGYSCTPFQVLEELVDNSIEHKSTQVQVTMDDYANCYIVEDNGEEGIPTDIFLNRYHTMYAEKKNRTGLGFFGVGSMAFKAISDVRITITKNNDGIYYSIWDTSKTIDNVKGSNIELKDSLPKALEKYVRPITRFLHHEKGNGTMVIIPKPDKEWGEYNNPIEFRSALNSRFEERYRYFLYLDGKIDKIITRVRTSSDRQFVYPILSKNILPQDHLKYERCGITICTWWDSKPSIGKKMCEIYLMGVKVGQTDIMKKGARKKFVPASASERSNIKQVIFCPIEKIHLLEANPIKDGYGIKKKWINEMRAKMVSEIYEKNTVLEADTGSKQEPRTIPKFFENIPALHKAIKSNNGKFLGDYVLKLVQELTDPKLSAISIDRKIERAATPTQNNGENNE